jgi:hypothetical protein
MEPAAPARLSITTGCLSITESFSPTMRASASVLPPAPKGTTMRSGLSGQAGDWA